MTDSLLPDLERPCAAAHSDEVPQCETANREEIELYPCDLVALFPPGHAARGKVYIASMSKLTVYGLLP